MDKENEEEGDAANTLDSAVLGIAVFSGDKMIGSLNKYESAYYMMLRGEFKGGMMTFPEPEDSSRNMVIDISVSYTHLQPNVGNLAIYEYINDSEYLKALYQNNILLNLIWK